jgi:carbamoyltransferase
LTAILGISAFYHDSAAALVVDGAVVAAAQEERFTRKKHDPAFPERAVAWCLADAGLTLHDLDYVAFYEKPLAKFERLLETYLAFAPQGIGSFGAAIPVWLKEKLHTRANIRRGIGGPCRARLIFTDHHESHAASAFFPSPFERAAILTLDGVGEWSTATTGVGQGNIICLDRHLTFPHSLGLLYSAFTYYCGFKVNSGEYKLMGLAPYGRPVYEEAIRKHLIKVRPDGSFRLDTAYFNYCQGLTMTAQRFHRLFDGPPRRPEADLTQRHMDLAASIQAVTDDIVLRMGRDLHARTGIPDLVLAGGVALNCVANGRLLREGPFRALWTQPAAGDAGGALGAALLVWHQLLENDRRPGRPDGQCGSLLGPVYAPEEIDRFLDGAGAAAKRFDDEPELLRHVAGLLDEGKIIGWFHGRLEFGPRALGARSILGDPRSPIMQSRMNMKIKARESFRPFAPAVLAEYAHDWFCLEPATESPYMLLVAPVRDCHRLKIPPAEQALMESHPDLRQRVNVVRSTVPAITHVDYSARVQTVDEVRFPRFYRLLKAFYSLTGCPMLVNTSFNVRGEPIVCTPREAFDCFHATEMDVLVLEDFVLDKSTARERPDPEARHAYLARFQPD